MIPVRIYYLILVFLLCAPVHPKNFLIHTYTINDGLPGSRVNDICQDSLGRIWFASRGGISCYDGFGWKNYNVGTGLPVNNFYRIDSDDQGRLWACSRSIYYGLFNFRDGQWTRIASQPFISGSDTYISSLKTFSSGDTISVLMGTLDEGVLIWKNNFWSRFNEADGKPTGRVFNIISFDGQLLILTSGGMFSYDGTRFRPYTLPELPHGQIVGIGADSSAGSVCGKRLWLLGRNWLGYYNEDGFHAVDADIDFGAFQNLEYIRLQPDAFGGVYFGDIKIIYYYDPAEGTVSPLTKRNGLLTEGASSYFLDREKTIWISQLRGVSKVSSMRFYNLNRDHGLYEDEVSAVVQRDDGEYIFGHGQGLTFVNDESFETLELPVLQSRVRGDSRILDMAVDKDRNVWIASYANGLALISPDRRLRWLNNTIPPACPVRCCRPAEPHLGCIQRVYLHDQGNPC